MVCLLPEVTVSTKVVGAAAHCISVAYFLASPIVGFVFAGLGMFGWSSVRESICCFGDSHRIPAVQTIDQMAVPENATKRRPD